MNMSYGQYLYYDTRPHPPPRTPPLSGTYVVNNNVNQNTSDLVPIIFHIFGMK